LASSPFSFGAAEFCLNANKTLLANVFYSNTYLDTCIEFPVNEADIGFTVKIGRFPLALLVIVLQSNRTNIKRAIATKEFNLVDPD
jgi:hypothetical protein